MRALSVDEIRMHVPDLSASTLTVYETRAAWLEARADGIGSSDAAAVLNCSPWKSRYTVWAEKTGKLERAGADSVPSEPARWGHILEPIVAQEFELVRRRRLFYPGPFTIARSVECPFMCASHDRLIPAEGSDPRGFGVLSIKTVDKFKAPEWVDHVPVDYQVQLQHEMAVSGARWGAIAVLFGGNDFRIIDFERDDAFIETLKRELFDFWAYVERTRRGLDDAPPVDGSESTAETLRRIYPRDEGYTVELPEAALQWDEDLRSIKKRQDELKKARQKIENQLIACIGSARFGVLPGKVGRYLYRVTTRKEHVVKESSFRELRRVKMPASNPVILPSY